MDRIEDGVEWTHHRYGQLLDPFDQAGQVVTAEGRIEQARLACGVALLLGGHVRPDAQQDLLGIEGWKQDIPRA